MQNNQPLPTRCLRSFGTRPPAWAIETISEFLRYKTLDVCMWLLSYERRYSKCCCSIDFVSNDFLDVAVKWVSHIAFYEHATIVRSLVKIWLCNNYRSRLRYLAALLKFDSAHVLVTIIFLFWYGTNKLLDAVSVVRNGQTPSIWFQHMSNKSDGQVYDRDVSNFKFQCCWHYGCNCGTRLTGGWAQEHRPFTLRDQKALADRVVDRCSLTEVLLLRYCKAFW